LFEAKKRYGLTVLNYMVTSNHVHLLVSDEEDESRIGRSMQLVAGRTAQAYNLRKRRRGAFWEDRYHATAVQTGEQLRRCMAYIDLNMIRAGAVREPCDWEFCGYAEIQNPPRRWRIVDRAKAAELLGLEKREELAAQQRQWTTAEADAARARDDRWTESLAVGDRGFVEVIAERLGVRARHRGIVGDGPSFVLWEAPTAYRPNMDPENEALSTNNTRLWNAGR
jgi:putative transposase